MVGRFVAVAVGIALSTFVGGVPAQAASPIFSAQCPVSHRAPDDPIVHPGRQGAAHMHDFSGNWSARYDSTYDTMRSAPRSGPGTTCDPHGDTAGYWVPTFYNPSGGIVENVASTAYYVPGKYGATNLAAIRAFPADLKIVADMEKSGPYGSGWHCGDATLPAKGGTLNSNGPPDCRNRTDGPGGIFPDDTRVQAKIVFPDCWNGVSLDSADHRSHMAYSGTAGCPVTHPVSLPRLNMKVKYETFGGSGFTLSSGQPSTMHADFWNTWEQAELEKRVQHCLNEANIRDTSTDPCTNDGDPGPQTIENPFYPEPAPAPGDTPPEPAAACADAIDNDLDGKTDMDDPGCSSGTDDDETDPVEEPAPTGSWSHDSVVLGSGTYRPIADVLGPDDSYTLKVSYTGAPGNATSYLMHVGNSSSSSAVIYTSSGKLRAAVTVNGSTKTLSTTFAAGRRHDLVLTRSKNVIVLYVGGVRKASSTGAPNGVHDLGPGAMGARRLGDAFSNFAAGTYHSASVQDRVMAP